MHSAAQNQAQLFSVLKNRNISFLTVGLIIGNKSLNLPGTEQDESERERGEDY